MKKRYLFLSLILLLLKTPQGECLSDKDLIYRKSASNAAKALEKKFGIHCCGTGGSFKDKIDVIGLSFQMNKEASLNEARKCIFNIMNESLLLLNSYTHLTPFMSHCPLTKENIEVKIFFHTKEMGDVAHPFIATAAWTKNRFSFYVGNGGDDSKPTEIIYETYEEAQREWLKLQT